MGLENEAKTVPSLHLYISSPRISPQTNPRTNPRTIPHTISASQLPSPADVCLLAGVLCSHDWLRNVVLDGNPLDEGGLGYLCQALLMNRRVESVSLRRCGLGERAASLLSRMLTEKPGLEVDASEGNPMGEELSKKVGRPDPDDKKTCCGVLGMYLSGGLVARQGARYVLVWAREVRRADAEASCGSIGDTWKCSELPGMCGTVMEPADENVQLSRRQEKGFIKTILARAGQPFFSSFFSCTGRRKSRRLTGPSNHG